MEEELQLRDEIRDAIDALPEERRAEAWEAEMRRRHEYRENLQRQETTQAGMISVSFQIPTNGDSSRQIQGNESVCNDVSSTELSSGSRTTIPKSADTDQPSIGQQLNEPRTPDVQIAGCASRPRLTRGKFWKVLKSARSI